MNEARIGCSGWNYRDWRDDFYPPKTPTSRWLAHYASVFDTVEGQRDLLLEGFLFAVKGSCRPTSGATTGCWRRRWRRCVAAWRARRPVFVYLNNDWQGFAPRNALTLRRGLS